MAKIFSLLLAVVLVGCASAPTQVIVTVDAEAGVKAAATQLHLVVFGGVGRMVSPTAERFDRVLTPGTGEDPAYSFEIALAPLDSDVGRSYSVTATAETATGAFVGQARIIGGYVEGQTLFVRVLLEDACREVVCAVDETCSRGSCVDAGQVGVGDAGVDLGRDAGDAGVDLGRDAGVDLGRDAGPVDGGGTCPAFSPGTWRVVGTQGLVRTDCPAAFTRDVVASTLGDLQTVCPTCSTTSTLCESVRTWTSGGFPRETRITLATESHATGVSGETYGISGSGVFNFSTCYLRIEAVRVGP